MSQNKAIVEKTQEILEGFGYKVKTGHLYELFSKLSNESSWNVGKAKNTQFSDLGTSPNQELIPPEEANKSLEQAFKERKKELISQLRFSINKNFKEGNPSYIINEIDFNSFKEVEGTLDLNSLLAELEKLGYAIESQPINNILVIKANQSKKESFSFKDFLLRKLPKYVDPNDFLTNYRESLKNGDFRDVSTFGLKDDGSGYLKASPFDLPGSLFCGSMGSGKSIAGRFSAVTNLLANGDKAICFFVDPLKGAQDYRLVLKGDLGTTKENTIGILNSMEKVGELIEFLDQEAEARTKVLIKEEKANIKAYNEAYPDNKIAELHVYIEDFHAIPNSDLFKFSQNVDKPGSLASKLKSLTRIGRSLGIFLNLTTQRATYDDIPSSLRPGISHVFCFRSSRTDAAALNLSHAAEIKSHEHGKCAYEGGFLQFPYLSDNDINGLFSEFSKPLKAKTLSLSVEELKKKFKA